jgi:hypothetical protein
VSALQPLTPPSRWNDRYAAICRRYRKLVAVYESADGRYALLLSDTLVPLAYEHRAWLKSTRATVRAVVRELRAAGLARHFFIMQWWPLERLAPIFDTWQCRHDADPARRQQHMRVVAGQLADRHFLCSRWVPDAEPGRGRGRLLTSIL